MFDISMEQYKDDMLRDLVNFIKIESIKGDPEPNKPYGKGVFDALMYVLNIAGKMDFDCVNLFGHMACIDYGSGDETLAILTHIDVVPAGEGWTKPPFGGVIENGRVYGRGAIDNKGPAIAALYALKALSDNLVDLDKKVRLIFGCDEESGWSDMAFYKQHEPLPDIAFSPDGDYPIINAEKGLMHIILSAKAEKAKEGVRVLRFNAGERANVVPNKASCLVAADAAAIRAALQNYTDAKGAALGMQETDEGIVLNARGTSAHGSRPEDGVNAAAALLVFLNTLPLAPDGINPFIKLAAEKIGHAYNGANMGLDIADDISGPLTLNLGILNADEKNFTMVIDIRYPVTAKDAFVMQKLKEHLGGTLEIKIQHALDPHYLPESARLIVQLKEAYEEMTGEKAYCMSVGGATYARAFENAVTFGPRFPGKPSVEHGPDEYIEIDELMLDAKIIANAIMKICVDEQP